MATAKLTKALIEGLAPSPKPSFNYDTQTKGLAIRVSGSTKTFTYQGGLRVPGSNRKKVRVSIGRWPAWSVDQARDYARELQVQFDKGVNPNKAKKQATADAAESAAKAVTLKAAWKAFRAANSVNLKPSTVAKYQQHVDRLLSDWQDRPLASLSVAVVAERHRKITEENGARTANLAMATLSTIWNHTRLTHRSPADDSPILGECPVAVLRATKQWHAPKRRVEFLRSHEFGPWLDEVEKLKWDMKDHTVRDYLKFLLFTGMRSGEASGLQWEDVDFKGGTVTVRNTKNGSDFALPLGPYLIELLQARHVSSKGENKYVFPSRLIDKRKSDKIGWVHKQMQLIARVVGTKCDSPHDLRRSFATIAEDVLGKDSFRVKLLLNHKPNGDVTSGYVILSEDKLRNAMIDIENCILRLSSRSLTPLSGPTPAAAAHA